MFKFYLVVLGSGYFIILMVNLLRVKSCTELGYNYSCFTRQETEVRMVDHLLRHSRK